MNEPVLGPQSSVLGSKHPRTEDRGSRTRWYSVALTLIVLIGVARIVTTYNVFAETIDEPAHIASGMEWIDRGTYETDASHPPLARITAALWPYLSGIRSIKTDNFVVDGNHVFYANNRYLTNVSRSRAGILPFFVAAVLIVAAWARHLWGDIGGLAAALLFSNEPNILAHSGLVTTDMAAATLTVAAAYAFFRSAVAPATALVRVMVGITLGLAILAKFSTLLFVPIACAAVILCTKPSPKDLAKTIAVATPIAFLVVALFYRFHLGDLWQGIYMVRMHSKGGHHSYLLGEFRMNGWWYYFPLAIAVKTTIGFLILVFIGAWRSRTREQFAPLLAGLLILIVSLPVTINIGVRHILPIYPFFAIVAAGAFVWQRWIAAALGVAAIAASVAAHPDYLPYFNAFAGPRPDRIFVDSNLDWGQDLLRLVRELRVRNVESVALAYAGSAEPDRHRMPRITRVDPLRYTPGWVAISEVLAHSDGPQYRWLEHFEPVARVGKSIRLYHLPAANPSASYRTPLLLPIWFKGTFSGVSAWLCDFVINNDGNTPVTIDAPNPIRVAAHAQVVNPDLGIGDARDGGVIYVRARDMHQLRFNLNVRSPAGQAVELPVVGEHDLTSEPIRFSDVPISDSAAATLRVYDVVGQSSSINVKLIEGDNVTEGTVGMWRHSRSLPRSTSVALNRLFPGRNLRDARILIDPPSESWWACITVSERDTNRAWVILPAK